ncbi:hypothetical protein AOLI_G00254140 [Acnodon oligacanthus]
MTFCSYESRDHTGSPSVSSLLVRHTLGLLDANWLSHLNWIISSCRSAMPKCQESVGLGEALPPAILPPACPTSPLHYLLTQSVALRPIGQPPAGKSYREMEKAGRGPAHSWPS